MHQNLSTDILTSIITLDQESFPGNLNQASVFMDMIEVANFLGFKNSNSERNDDIRRSKALRFCRTLSKRCGREILIPFTSEGKRRVGKWMVAKETLLQLVKNPEIISAYEKIEELNKKLIDALYRINSLEEKIYNT